MISFSSIFRVADIRQDPVEEIPIALSPLLKFLPPGAGLRQGVKRNVLAPGLVDRQVRVRSSTGQIDRIRVKIRLDRPESQGKVGIN